MVYLISEILKTIVQILALLKFCVEQIINLFTFWIKKNHLALFLINFIMKQNLMSRYYWQNKDV